MVLFVFVSPHFCSTMRKVKATELHQGKERGGNRGAICIRVASLSQHYEEGEGQHALHDGHDELHDPSFLLERTHG